MDGKMGRCSGTLGSWLRVSLDFTRLHLKQTKNRTGTSAAVPHYLLFHHIYGAEPRTRQLSPQRLNFPRAPTAMGNRARRDKIFWGFSDVPNHPLRYRSPGFSFREGSIDRSCPQTGLFSKSRLTS